MTASATNHAENGRRTGPKRASKPRPNRPKRPLNAPTNELDGRRGGQRHAAVAGLQEQAMRRPCHAQRILHNAHADQPGMPHRPLWLGEPRRSCAGFVLRSSLVAPTLPFGPSMPTGRSGWASRRGAVPLYTRLRADDGHGDGEVRGAEFDRFKGRTTRVWLDLFCCRRSPRSKSCCARRLSIIIAASRCVFSWLEQDCACCRSAASDP
jgi:hypothetical protein